MTQRFALIDALRGLAALAVVLHHGAAGGHIPFIIQSVPAWAGSIFHNGDLGVAVFFVLSGFVIAHSLYSVKIDFRVAGRFMLRRSIRLDPPYWAAIALAVSLAYISTFVVPDKAVSYSVAQFLAHIFYAQDILNYQQINSVFWTLCMEIQFYLVYVVALTAIGYDPERPLSRKLISVLFAAAIISALWPLGIVTTEPWRASFLPVWHGFLIGVGAYWAWRQPALKIPFLIFTFAILATAVLTGAKFSTACATAGLFIYAACITNNVGRLDWRWLQALGLISYSLYLTHNPITGASFRVGYMLTGNGSFWQVVWFAASLLACLVVAGVMWLAIERPSVIFARSVSMRPPRQVALSKRSFQQFS